MTRAGYSAKRYPKNPESKATLGSSHRAFTNSPAKNLSGDALDLPRFPYSKGPSYWHKDLKQVLGTTSGRSSLSYPRDLFEKLNSFILKLGIEKTQKSLHFTVSTPSTAAGAIQFYSDSVRNAELRARSLETAKRLSEAARDRDLIDALLRDEWLGLQILVFLKSCSKLRLGDLASKVKEDTDRTAAALTQICQFGAATVDDDAYFVCTERGINIVDSLERNSGISLAADREESAGNGILRKI